MDAAQIPVLVAALALSACGVLVIRLSRRAKNDRLPRNKLAGIRTSLTLSSDAAWYAAHRASARATAISGWGPIVGGTASAMLILVRPPTDATMIAAAAMMLAAGGWLITWSLVGAARAQRAARSVTDHP